MVHLSDLFDPAELDAMLTGRYVRAQRDSTGTLTIFNYTDETQYRRMWNDVTSACRGLIVHTATGQVLARPFRKFFNYGEVGTEAITSLDEPVVVTDKADGSLGILYTDPAGRPAIATRGSFTSEQAQHATALYRQRYAGQWSPDPALTYLFEIVYPDNRIVVNYDDLDDLILLGAVDIVSGRSQSPQQARGDWPGLLTQTFAYTDLAAALAAPDRPGREGLVVHFTTSDERVKIKQADYVRLHRLLTGCSARRIWQEMAIDACADLIESPKHWGTYLGIDPAQAQAALSSGRSWRQELLTGVPDEFYAWVRSTIDDLAAAQVAAFNDALNVLRDAQSTAGTSPRALYEAMADHPWVTQLLRAAQGKPQQLTLRSWRDICPDADLPVAAA